ncbi:Guard cell S-type anion channel slac1 [Castilleja foliolosa]|uniref:Guard cell S-type anion channel slac1 n=1 Tax=Castilleja foliolosa TaxID=1961234 RepID=A0ABD3BPK2_9LAMI
MEMKETSRRHPGTHFVDIHEVQEEEYDDEEGDKPTQIGEKRYKKARETKRAHNKNFIRQVSLETGFSALNGESKQMEMNTLPRSGKSFGGFGSSHRIGGEEKKVDFSIFRTKSNLVRQSSKLAFRKESGIDNVQYNDNVSGGQLDESLLNKSVPAGRYFAALRGPELDEVKDSEDILLPKDEKWPFLLRFPIGCFGICLGLSSQAILWRVLSTSQATKFLHITPLINLSIWLLALCFLIAVFITYTLKCVFYFEAVKREYFHPVRVNFFFAPWIVCMFLAIGVPSQIAPDTMHPSVWCAFMGPIIFLDLKVYGQWLSGGKRRLCKVANPSSHLSVVGNFVGAILAAKRLPTSEALPKELHPVYSMFIATPAAASIAWGAVYGEFDGLARTCFFIALFLYCSLIVRINFFRGFRFSVAWWSYTFPMTTASIASIKYAEQVPCVITKALALTLSFMSSTMVAMLFVSTILHAFVWKTLFPNDLAIAIAVAKRRQVLKEKKPFKKAYDIRRWTKQSPLSLVSNMGVKHNSADKGGDEAGLVFEYEKQSDI